MAGELPTTVDPNNALHPCIAVAHISTSFSSNPLDKTVGNWKTWNSKIQDNLTICGLGNHIKEIKAGSTIIPDAKVQLIAHDNWNTNVLKELNSVSAQCFSEKMT